MKTENKNEENPDISQKIEDLMGKEILAEQKRHNWEVCGPLGVCGDDISGMTEEVEKETMEGMDDTVNLDSEDSIETK